MYIRLLIYLLILCSAFSSCNTITKDAEWPDITNETKPRTRWWWMGSAVDKDNLTYNLEELSRAGIGGVEITPVYGVKGEEDNYIDYLSPQWMDMLSFTESEAERLGISVDMNMGTGWPFGGPDVSLDDAATKAFFQHYKIKAGEKLNDKIQVDDEEQKYIGKLGKLMAYASDGESIDITNKLDTEGNLHWTAPEDKDYTVIALFIGKTFQKVKRAAPGGEGFVLNHMDSEAVKRYIHRFEQAFSANKTDYPNCFFNDSYEVYGADWTPDLLEQFEKRRGYKLEDYFPELLADGKIENSARIISDYRETVGELLMENFTILWTEWANEKRVTTRNQAHGSPANLIDLYAAVDIPECESFGITDFDIPLLRKDPIRKENDGDPATLKFASSAAHITGKKYTSSETFTWLTEHFRTSLSQCKPEIDQMFTAGVNQVYFHGSTYSPKEAAWPGWKFYASVDMSPTNSIWRDAPAFFDYITRVQSFLQYGIPDNDFLLYFPVYDIWNEQRGDYFHTFTIHGMREKLSGFYKTVSSIRDNGYDVDYISDSFIQTIEVEHGALKTKGGIKYKALILPSVKLIPYQTLEKIRELVEQGAKIVFVGNYPSDVPGFTNLEERRDLFKRTIQNFPEVTSFMKTSVHRMGSGTIITGSNYKDLLNDCNIRAEAIKTKFGAQFIRREHTNGYHYFITMLQNDTVDGWVPLATKAKSAVYFDPLTGRTGKAAIRNEKGRTEVFLQLKPGESIILKTFSHKQVEAYQWDYYKETGNQVCLDKGWEMHFIESEPMVNEHFELPTLHSWTELPNGNLQKNKGTARYKISFDLKKDIQSEYRLCLGDVRESACVYINGEPVTILFAVPFETNIGSFLKEGSNTLEVEVTNLPANRIADYDKQGIDWRIFHEINFVSITYKDVLFDNWEPMPSGLLGPVVVKELKRFEP